MVRTEIRIREKDVLLFAALTGDNNPIHVDAEYAKTTRFKGRIVHGMFVASLISSHLGNIYPGRGSVYISQSLEFKAPVFIDDTVNVSVSKLSETEKTITLKTECHVYGKLVLTGEAVMLKKESHDED